MSQSFDSLLLDRILCLNPTDDTSYIKLLAKNTVLRIADRLYRLTTNHSLDLKPNKTYDKSIAVLQKMFEEMKVTLKTFYDPLSELTENKSILEFVLDENESKLKDFRNLENKVKNHQEKCLNDEKIIKNGNIEDPVDQNVPEPVPRGPKNCHENDSCPIRVEKTENLMNPTEFVQKTDHLNVKVSNESPNCTESTDEEHPRQELAQNKSPNPCHDFFVTKPIIPTKVFNPKYPVLLLNLPDYLNSPYFNNQNDEEILTDLLKDYKPQTLRRFRYFLFFDEMVRNITRFMGREWALIFIDDKWLLGQCDRSLD